MDRWIIPMALCGLGFLQSCGGTSRPYNSTETDSVAVVTEIVVDSLSAVTVDEDTWRQNFFVDDFGEKTNEGYIINSCVGEFSNSATTNSRLTVRIIATPEGIRFDLYEYGSHMVKGEGILQFRVKLPDDTEYKFKTDNYDDGVNPVTSSYIKEVQKLFETYPRLRFAAKTTSRYSLSTYRFVYEGDPEEFKAKLEELSKK